MLVASFANNEYAYALTLRSLALHAHGDSPEEHCSSRLVPFAIRTLSVRKSALPHPTYFGPPLEGGPKSLISRRGSERSELLTPHQGRLACTTTLETAKEVRSTIFHDKTHYRATEPASCKSLVPQCLSNLAPSFALSVRKSASPLVP